MSHFTVKNQAIGVMDIVDDGILQGNLSGLMGLAWTYLAKTGADPWWLTAIKTGLWTEPLFGFYLARWVDDPSATDLEAKGGSMDLGFANSDYYTGNINYVNLSAENFWLIPMGGITINGERLDPGGHAAIDTCVPVFFFYLALFSFAIFLTLCFAFLYGIAAARTSLAGPPR